MLTQVELMQCGQLTFAPVCGLWTQQLFLGRKSGSWPAEVMAGQVPTNGPPRSFAWPKTSDEVINQGFWGKEAKWAQCHVPEFCEPEISVWGRVVVPINDGVPHGALLLWSPCRTFHENSGWLTDLGLKETDACSRAGCHSGSGAGWLSHLSTQETEAEGLSVWGSQGERALGQEELSLG